MTYVAGPLAAFALAGSPRDRLWIAERDARIVDVFEEKYELTLDPAEHRLVT